MRVSLDFVQRPLLCDCLLLTQLNCFINDDNLIITATRPGSESIGWTEASLEEPRLKLAFMGLLTCQSGSVCKHWT